MSFMLGIELQNLLLGAGYEVISSPLKAGVAKTEAFEIMLRLFLANQKNQFVNLPFPVL